MTVPPKDKIKQELLDIVSDGQEHCFSEVQSRLTKIFDLSERDLVERIPSGSITRFESNIRWSITELVEQKRVERTKRGCFRILKGDSATEKALTSAMQVSPSTKLPDVMREIHERINARLAEEILSEVKNASPLFLENLALELLKKMGYGKKVLIGEAGKRVGGVGDGGVDGLVKEDMLGFDVIYYQTKRWDSNPVSAKEISAFAGDLDRHKSIKGVFITTSQFSNAARKAVQEYNKKIVLISGEELARLMIEHGIGVSVKQTYHVKEIDSDFFEEPEQNSGTSSSME